MIDFRAYLHNYSLTSPRLIMGILNVTPDSIHDGGLYDQQATALNRLRQLLSGGAHIVDLGAMSSRPGYKPISTEEEIARLSIILEAELPESILFSVDTDKPKVAQYALNHGVQILNDCSGLLQDDMYDLAARTGAPLIVMHRQGVEGQHHNICQEVLDFFQRCLAFGEARGVKRKQFILDPGFGFNKSVSENLELFHGLSNMCRLGLPVLTGFSHKRFIAAASGEPTAQTPGGNLAASAYAIAQGAAILRMHDIDLLPAFITAVQTFWSRGEGELFDG